MPDRILVVVHSNTFFVEMHRVGLLLKKHGYEPLMLFSRPYEVMGRDILHCVKDGLTCLGTDGQVIRSPETLDIESHILAAKINTQGVFQKLGKLVKNAARWTSPIPLVDFLRYYRYHKNRMAFATSVIRRYAPRLVVMAGDMPGYDTADVIDVAHRQGLPVILVPSTMSNGREQAEAYYRDLDYQAWVPSNRIAGWLFPKWLRRHRGKTLIRRPAGDVYAMEYLRIAPPLPWIFNSGFADAICVESDAMRDYYLHGGLPEWQLVSTGSLANDVLAAALRQREERLSRLLDTLDMDPKPLTVLTAIPPDSLNFPGGRPECEFSDYRALVKAWLEPLRSMPNANVLVSLHPSVDASSVAIDETRSLRLVDMQTAEVIPLCDVYIACVSSTIRWAIASGKPVVNYDVYRYRYDDFRGVPGVIHVESHGEYSGLLARLARDPAVLESLRKAQQSIAPYWGCLDGRCGRRLVQLIVQLMGKSKQQAA